MATRKGKLAGTLRDIRKDGNIRTVEQARDKATLALLRFIDDSEITEEFKRCCDPDSYECGRSTVSPSSAFVLECKGLYVRCGGFTVDLGKARFFPTREAAERELVPGWEVKKVQPREDSLEREARGDNAR